MKSKVQITLLVVGVTLAFAAGSALGAECSYHQPTCTYRVSGCIPIGGSCQQHGGGTCYMEYGNCCPGGGSDYTTFCAPSCDGSGGGPPCSD
jgi:hypothetical protein